MIEIDLGIAGYVTLHKGKLDSRGEPVTREHITTFKNLVLDAGLSRIGTNGDWMDWLHLGSGIQAPHPLQITLQNPTYTGNALAPGTHTTAGIDNSDPLKPYTWVRRVFRVSPRGENRTYAEMGVGWNSNNLFSRTLIKDPQGNPNTISILGDEYLDVTYEARMYIPVDTVVYEVVPTGDDTEPRTITVRGSQVNTWSTLYGWALAGTSLGNSPNRVPTSILNNWLTSAHNRFFTGGLGGLYQDPEDSIVGTTFNRTSMVRTSPTSATITLTRELPDNVGMLRTLQISQEAYCFQMEFNPPFNKSNEDRFSISYSISWGRDEE